MTTVTAPPRRVIECMGTVFSFDLRSPVDPAYVQDAIALLHRVDATFSTYRPASEISRLGRGELDEADCSADVAHVLRQCRRLARLTGGYFDAYAGGRLDPSGYVKGWAIRLASDILRAGGSTSHCVNGGGDVQCVGDAASGVPWRVGIAHPLAPGRLAAVAAGSGIAVATSGSAERGAHVLDPHTGRPPQGLASVTVVGRDLAEVDAHATAAYAMGEAAEGWLATLAGYSAFIVRSDSSTWAGPGWRTA